MSDVPASSEKGHHASAGIVGGGGSELFGGDRAGCDAGLRRRFAVDRGAAGLKLFGEPNDRFGFSLCLSAKGALASLEPFLRDAEGLLGRARKVPWLSRFAAEHSEARIFIEYFDDGSLSPYALHTLRYDMDHLYHNPELVSVADADLDRSLGITVESGKESGTWIVLPDARGLFLYGEPFGAVETQLDAGRLIQADGSGGVTEEERARG